MANLNEMSKDQLVALVAQLQAQPARKLSLKVSAKGAVSLYGMGRFPVTLYAEQWERVFAARTEIEAFIKANAATISRKPD